MANYANSRGFAGAFNNLTGILNMFLQNQMNRSNIEDDRKYQDETYEKKLKDAIVTSMMNNAIKGNADLYETSLTGQGAARTITPQTVMGKTVSSAATPIETEDKITKINAGDFGRLRNNSIRYVPRTDIAGGKTDYTVMLDDQTAKILNSVYNTKYTAGQRVPYNLLSGLSSLTTNQRRQENAGVITPKEAMNQLNKWRKSFDPYGNKNDDDMLIGMVEDPIANGYLQKSGLYDDVLKKYKEAVKRKQDTTDDNNDGGFWSRLLGNKKQTKTEPTNNENTLRQQAIEQLKQQGYKVTEDNIKKVVALLKKK